MDVISKITQTIEPSLTSMGYSVVLLKLAEGGSRKTLMVMAERADDRMMSFDDCTEISRTVSALLDVEDPINGAYDLEVCSPGIDRPLTRAADFTRFAGHEAKIETALPVDGRKRFKGVVKGMAKNVITLAMPEAEVQIPFGHIRTAKLVVTDALVEAHLNKQKKTKKKL
jgi:ribosome maturation factor RimP